MCDIVLMLFFVFWTTGMPVTQQFGRMTIIYTTKPFQRIFS